MLTCQVRYTCSCNYGATVPELASHFLIGFEAGSRGENTRPVSIVKHMAQEFIGPTWEPTTVLLLLLLLNDRVFKFSSR